MEHGGTNPEGSAQMSDVVTLDHCYTSRGEQEELYFPKPGIPLYDFFSLIGLSQFPFLFGKKILYLLCNDQTDHIPDNHIKSGQILP